MEEKIAMIDINPQKDIQRYAKYLSPAQLSRDERPQIQLNETRRQHLCHNANHHIIYGYWAVQSTSGTLYYDFGIDGRYSRNSMLTLCLVSHIRSLRYVLSCA